MRRHQNHYKNKTITYPTHVTKLQQNYPTHVT